MEQTTNNKKKYLMVLGSLILVIALFGVTYAWFTYRRETGDQELVAGEIYLHLNEGQEEIELTNIFPETAAEARARNDNFITFTIDGKNTSNKTIYYEILLDHGADKASPKSRYNDSDLKFDLIELDSSSNEVDYLISGGSFDNLSERRIWVETVDANTTSEVVKRYKLRMWLDENVLISDSDPKRTYTASEYPNKYATVKLIVNGDFNEKHIDYLYNIMKRQAVMDNINSDYVDNETPGIDFGVGSSDTNGKGVYMRAGTQNDAYPIMYYRGAVEDNNVIFNDICWKVVRTTDTGGVKLIYNGEVSTMYRDIPLSENQYIIPLGETNDFTYNQADNSWEIVITDNAAKEISFTVPAGDGYEIVQTGTSGSSTGGQWFFYKDGINVKSYGNGGGQPMNDTYTFGTLNASNVIKWTYTGSSSIESPITFKLQMIQRGVLIAENACDNTGTDTQITLSGTNTFPFSGTNLYNSPAYNGYMYGTVYAYSTSGWTSGARFGSSFTWDGTNYTLVGDSVTTPNATHHYSCNVTTENGTCSQIRYVYYMNGSTKYYITLTGGDGIEEALVKMNTNTNDSNAKDKIETWYASNMNTVTNKLEDTIWCNDRSVENGNNNGWISNGGDLTKYLYYGAHGRSNYTTNTSVDKNQPSLSCPQKNDAFTVSNGNGNQKLTYPVALLTEDELMLAGGSSLQYEGSRIQSTFYLNNGDDYWSLSPFSFNTSRATNFSVYTDDLYEGDVRDINVGGTLGLRPSISLKSGTQVVSGSGTVADPYVIE